MTESLEKDLILSGGQSVADLVVGRVLAFVQSQRFAVRVLAGDVGWDLLRDLSRARYVGPLRRVIETDDYAALVASELTTLCNQFEDADLPYRSACAAAAVFLVRISKRILPTERGQPIFGQAVRLFGTLESLPEYTDLRVELALQLVAGSDPAVRRDAIRFLLTQPDSIERVREHYLEARSPADLSARIQQRWNDQGLDDTAVGESLRRFKGLSPFLHACPAPGGSSDAVRLTGEFAMAILKPVEERRRAVSVWLEDAARTQRLIQWEYYRRNPDGRFLGQGASGNLAILPDAEFFASLTNDWWHYVAKYEPVPFGRPVERSEPRDVPLRLLSSATDALSRAQVILDHVAVFARGDTHEATAQQMHREWRNSGRAGTLLVHDGELTHCALQWLHGNSWLLPQPQLGGNWVWRMAAFSDVVEFLGLGLVQEGDVVFSPRWRSYLRWVGLGDSNALNELDPDEARLCDLEKSLREFASKNLWPENLAERLPECRAPYLPLEAFLRAFRPWPSHLLVTTIHAQRARDQIRPLSFGFATIIGDLPFSTRAEWTRPAAPASAVEPAPGALEEGRRLFLSWLNNHCSLLAGIGMSLGVSPGMAQAIIDQQRQSWLERFWPEDTGTWFTGRTPPQHKWDDVIREDETGDSSISKVIAHLKSVTGLDREFWQPDFYFWEEMKRLFGKSALVAGPASKDRNDSLTLGGVWVLALAFLNDHGWKCPPTDRFASSESWLTETVLPNTATFNDQRALVSRLLDLFEQLFLAGGVPTVTSISRERGVLWFSLNIPLYKRSPGGRQSLWNALLTKDQGEAAGAVDAVRNALRKYRPAEGWLPAEILIVPNGMHFDPFDAEIRLGLRCGAPSEGA